MGREFRINVDVDAIWTGIGIYSDEVEFELGLN
jgi:hypothetical protein